VAEGKEVDRGVLSDPQGAKDAVGHATDLYNEYFVRTGEASGAKAD
jgi:hypothetical protein